MQTVFVNVLPRVVVVSLQASVRWNVPQNVQQSALASVLSNVLWKEQQNERWSALQVCPWG